MSKRVISIIREVMDQADTDRCSPRDLEQMSYTKWAASEILRYLNSHPNIAPISAIEDFEYKMNQFACLNRDTSYIFSVASNTADYIIELLLKEETKDGHL